jgi:hypothetical protein
VPRTFADSRVKTETGIVTGSTKTEAATAAPSTPAAAPEAGATGLSIVMISMGLVLLISAIGFAVLRAHRREHAELAAMTGRDIASVPLAGKPDRAALALVPSAVSPGSPRQAAARGHHPMSSHAPRGADGATLIGSGQMPETREQALQVLGMGLAGDTGLAAVKKVVDGLRMSWHPDYAVDQRDRAAREQRMKQINAAWEILNGSRAA